MYRYLTMDQDGNLDGFIDSEYPIVGNSTILNIDNTEYVKLSEFVPSPNLKELAKSSSDSIIRYNVNTKKFIEIGKTSINKGTVGKISTVEIT